MDKSQKSAALRSRSIDHQIDEAREKRAKEIQLLILGSAGSGKSTFTKQLRILYGDGYPEGERVKLRHLVFGNICDALTTVVDYMKTFNIKMEQNENKEIAEEFVQQVSEKRRRSLLALSRSSPTGNCEAARCSPEPTNHININMETVKKIWQDRGVQLSYERKAEYDIPVSQTDVFFLENVDRICMPNYVPTLQDVLYIRKPTRGIQEHIFVVNGLNYRVIDVAGQKNQRKKWIHFFAEVTAVIFFASLSSYCEKLEEEPSANSLTDSLQLFKEITSNEFLKKTSFILFLNKKDVLEERLKTRDLKTWLPSYTGEHTPEAVTQHLKEEFLKRKPPDTSVFPHVSCATDTSTMRQIIKDCMQIIIDINLKKTQQF